MRCLLSCACLHVTRGCEVNDRSRNKPVESGTAARAFEFYQWGLLEKYYEKDFFDFCFRRRIDRG